VLRGRSDAIASEMLAGENARVDALGGGLPGLERGVAWSNDFRARYESISTKVPQVHAVAMHFMERRQPVLGGSRKELERAIDAAPTPAALSALSGRYLLAADNGFPEGAQLWAAVSQRGSALRKWAVLRSDPEADRRAPRSDPGEPSEGDMYDAFDANLRNATANVHAMGNACNNMSNSADAIMCMFGGAMKQAGGDQPMAIQTFEKSGCARATGRYGYVCDFIVAISGGITSSPMLGNTLSRMAQGSSRTTARFSKDKAGWVMQPMEDERR
jgi:hypothetical protein